MIVSVAEEAARRGMMVAFLAGTIAAKRRDWQRLAKGWDRDGWDPQDFHSEVTTTFTDVMRYPLTPLLASMMQVGRTSMAESAGLDITQTDRALKVSDAWATRYGAAVVDDLATTNAALIAQQVPQWQARRLPSASIAVRAAELYGMDARSAAAYLAYGESDAKKKNLRALAEKNLENRATIIGDVHSFTALNTGRQMLLSEGLAQGFLKRGQRKVWVTALDERVCKVCGPMDGVAVPILEAFTVVHPPEVRAPRGTPPTRTKLITPPVHPHCRCTFVLDTKFEAGIITRTARFDDRGTAHLARLTSRAADLILQ